MHNSPMQRRGFRFAIGVLLLAGTVVARADKTDDYIKARMDEFHLPGLSLVVIKDGAIVKVAGYGLANVQGRIPATPDTVYKIGSVSKQFIATGIMLLVQEGRLGLDENISKYLQGTPAAWQPITIRHLLTHTAGLVRESPGFDALKVQSDADVIKAAYAVPLRSAPGEKWEYSNLGYYALADVIRTVTGRPWTEYLNEKVFRPSGMTVTQPTNTTLTVPNRAAGYTGNDNARSADDWTALRPSGAFLSTVLDLAKWEAVLQTDKVLNDMSRRQMWSAVQLTNGTAARYGFGWHVDSVGGHRRVRHGGGLPGFSSEYTRFMDDRLTVIVLTNGDDVDTADIANGLAARIYLPPRTP
jgi:CubicO group peptidase (beta-lactamase class C family)